MNEPHPLQVGAISREVLEGVDPLFIRDGLLRARQKTIDVLNEIRGQICEGMTEDDARKLSLEVFARHGAKKHWHRPFVRMGGGTVFTFNDPLQKDYRLQLGDPFYLDYGPIWPDPEWGLEYEGDYGDTFVLGSNPLAEELAQAARSLFQEAQKHWQENHATGIEIYSLLMRRAQEMGYSLVEQAGGHRVGDFPHHRFSKQSLSKTNFVPQNLIWVLEVQLLEPNRKFGAFFEDLL